MLTFSSNLAQPLVNRGLYRNGFSTFALTVYGGTRPSAAQVIANWVSTYNSANSVDLITHYLSVVLNPNANSGSYLNMAGSPAPVPSIRAGTATWAIMWNSNLAYASLSTTLPSTSFIIADVTAFGGNGIITFENPAFTLGESKPITSFHISGAMA
jgi:hypothetical protein